MRHLFLCFAVFLLIVGCGSVDTDIKNSAYLIESNVSSTTSIENKYIFDDAQMISDIAESDLETRLTVFEKQTTNQIFVVTLDDINGVDPLDYATDLGNSMGVGQKDKDNGVLLLIVKDERKMSIAAGKGLEKKLTDSICQNIIDTLLIPEFKKGEFDSGIISACDEIIAKLTKD